MLVKVRWKPLPSTRVCASRTSQTHQFESQLEPVHSTGWRAFWHHAAIHYSPPLGWLACYGDMCPQWFAGGADRCIRAFVLENHARSPSTVNSGLGINFSHWSWISDPLGHCAAGANSTCRQWLHRLFWDSEYRLRWSFFKHVSKQVKTYF